MAAAVSPGVVLLGVLLATGAGPLAQGGRRLAVVGEWPEQLEAVLNAAGAERYGCGVVARPAPPLTMSEAALLLVRANEGAGIEYRVAVGHARFERAALERAVSAAGEDGFDVCGVTVARRAGARSASGDRHVVVFHRERSQPMRPRHHRVIFTSGQGSEWSRVEAALKEGFALTHLVWSQPDGAGLPEVVFVATRDAGQAVGAADHTLESDPDAAGLTRRLTRRAREGYRVETAWASASGVSALMTRRVSTTPGSPDYMVSASSTGSFSPDLSGGHLVASIPFRGARFAIHDRSRPGAYTTFEREHASFTQLLGSPGAEARSFESALAERFDRGRERPVGFLYRETATRNRLRAEVIFDRTTSQ